MEILDEESGVVEEAKVGPSTPRLMSISMVSVMSYF
jgi:hypothetical protein